MKQSRHMELDTGTLEGVVRKRTSKTKIYLAHPGTNGVSKSTAKQIQKILEREGYIVFNPFDMDEKAKTLTRQWDSHPEVRTSKEFAKKIVEKDLNAIMEADVVVAFAPEPSVGTSMEIFFAFENMKPVFILTDHVSPWYINHGKVVSKMSELLEELKNAT